MKFRHELTYDASPADVFEMLADPKFREAACAAQDVIAAEVRVERRGDGFALTIDQEQRTDDLPAFARTFAGSSTRAILTEEWTDPTGGTMRIDAPGKPSQVSGTVSLSPDGARTRQLIELDLRIKVPLVGGKLEKLLAEKITAGLDAEHAVGRAYLEGNR